MKIFGTLVWKDPRFKQRNYRPAQAFAKGGERREKGGLGREGEGLEVDD